MSAHELPAGGEPLYVYGVVAAGTAVPPGTTGVAGGELEVVEHDGVAAVVSSFENGDTRLRRRDLASHLKALELVFEETTVAPCPFGTVVASREDVAERFLAPRRQELQQLLDRLEGHVQMNVKVDYDEEAVLGEILAEDRNIAAARDRLKGLGEAAYYENIRLGELVVAQLAERRARDADRIAAALSSVAAESLPEPPTGGELAVFKGSFLVERGQLADFDETLDRLAADDRELLRFEAIGPLPPTAFATLDGEA